MALDLADPAKARTLATLLAPEVGMFKVGKQLFVNAGPNVVRMIHDLGGEVFLDLKFHDIPNTVAAAAVEADPARGQAVQRSYLRRPGDDAADRGGGRGSVREGRPAAASRCWV